MTKFRTPQDIKKDARLAYPTTRSQLKLTN